MPDLQTKVFREDGEHGIMGAQSIIQTEGIGLSGYEMKRTEERV